MSTAASLKDANAAGGGRTRRRPQARARGLCRWLARAQGLGQGLTTGELVSELHVRRGLPLREVAEVLGVSLKVVRKHRPRKGKAEAAAVRAPKSAADLAGLREQVGVALWETVVATFSEMTLDATSGEGVPNAPRPPMMSVRIRALKQMAKLYGVGWKKRGGDGVVRECATPEEIVKEVREWRGK